MRRAAAVAKALPDGRHLINLCEHRENFLVACCAALIRGHTTLLPWARAEGAVEEVAARHAGSYRCDDDMVRSACENEGPRAASASASPGSSSPDAKRVRIPGGDGADYCAFEIPGTRVAVKAFTSGSTGSPQGHGKPWRGFVRSSSLNAMRIRDCLEPVHGPARPWVVATVPPQHMYGFETSVLLPLLSDMAVHAGRPLFPADIATALEEVPAPRVLVTTPVHMRAIVASGQRFPATALVLSATAPLDAALARAIETRLSTTVLELFGSTETCVIATRRAASEESWHLYPEVILEPDADGVTVSAPWFTGPMRLQDIVERLPGNRFLVRGRNSDMVEVAGKRASLGDLTRRLMAVPGVRDAVVFQPDTGASGEVRRVAALVVAPGVSTESICASLARSIDPAFVPRPLVHVDSLPRNEVGKLPRERLLAAIRDPAAG